MKVDLILDSPLVESPPPPPPPTFIFCIFSLESYRYWEWPIIFEDLLKLCIGL
jgi:hypothetical protein